MNRPFHTLPDIIELGLLVARIQSGSGVDVDIDWDVMKLFFLEDAECGWYHPQTSEWIIHPRAFSSALDDILLTQREFLPESSWMLQAPWEAPATALVKNGAVHKASTALSPERALLTAFLCLADQLQRAAA